MMLVNPLKQKLSEKRLVVGHCVTEFAVPNIGWILKPLEPDFVLIDMEHTGLSLEHTGAAISSCRLSGLVPIVRVPALLKHYIARCLDLGALGIMIPNVTGPTQARHLVSAAKYPPLGQRGMALGAAHTEYARPDPSEYAQWANEQVVLIAQIESQEGLANVDEIAAVPGIDVPWVGHTDLSLNLGIVAQYENEHFIDALRTVAAAAQRHGKAAGIQAPSLELAERWHQLGYDVLSLSVDIAVYQDALRKGLSAMRDLA